MNSENKNKTKWRNNYKKPFYQKNFRNKNKTGNHWRGNASNNHGGPSNDNQTNIQSMLSSVHNPYRGWGLYFTEHFKPRSEAVKYIQKFENYLQRNHKILESAGEKHFFLVDVQHFLMDDGMQEDFSNLGTMLVDSPRSIISSLGLAAYQILSSKQPTTVNHDTEDSLVMPPDQLQVIHARLTNLPKLTRFEKLRSNLYGKLVSIKGTVVRVSNIKPLCIKKAFRCVACGITNSYPQEEGKYTIPASCSEKDCQSSNLNLVICHNFTKTVDSQTFRLQEIISDDQREGGRVPRTIDCEVTDDVVDACIPGDIVTVTGIVMVDEDEEKYHSKRDQSMHCLYIQANSVVNCKNQSDSTSSVGIQFSIKDYGMIEKIRTEPELFRLLVASLCPGIFGHETVKAGMLLCMFGGCAKEGVRGEPHILVVGDPGLGKSQMLQACCNVTPRSVYVCGNTSTTSGLTVTLTREAGTGDYSLEGGALVLADQGVCCIDEFDKMSNQHQALLESMEQQSISIAKAGVVCSLPARTSIIAAANPIGGHYNKAKTVAENIKMGAALLSRFDLVFILLDKPDEDLDNRLSAHVMSIHSTTKIQKEINQCNNQDVLNTSVINSSDKSLSKRLQVDVDQLDLIPHQLMRKYISYARRYAKPKITLEAAKVIQQFYLELRKKLQNSDSTPITTRQLESLIRLSQARARCELREEVTESDAKDVIEMMKFSMVDTYSDELGVLDFQRSQHGSGTSSKGMMKKFVKALQSLSDATSKCLFSLDELRQVASEANIQVTSFNEFVETLNHNGYLLKKGPKVYQLLTAG